MRAWTGVALLGVTVVSLFVPAVATHIVAAPAPFPAPRLQAISTGAGRITLYWTEVPGAVEYRIFRGERAGRADMRHPLNTGQLPRRSYEGSPWFMVVDTNRGRGLRNGRVYYYRVRAIGPDGQESLSGEESDVVDPSAIPWDSREPKLIITAINHVAQPDEGDPLQGGITVAGPDNYLYEYDPRTGRYSGRPNPWIVSGDIAENLETGESMVLPGGASGGTVVTP